jgi:hypothetical protein
MTRQNPAAAFGAGTLRYQPRTQKQRRRQPAVNPACRRPGNPEPKPGRDPGARNDGAAVASVGRGTCGR